MFHACQRFFFGYVTKPSRFAHHWQVAKPLRLPRKPTSESCDVLQTYPFFKNTFTFDMCFMHFSTPLPKLVRAWCVLYFLTSKSASLHNGARCVNVLTSQSGPSHQFFKLLRGKTASRHNGMHFFDTWISKSVLARTFDFEMYFAPQRRAIFIYFSFLVWPHGPAPRFQEPTFRSSGATHHWKKTLCATFLPFHVPASSFFWLSFSFFPSMFLMCPYCRKFDF